MQAAAIRERVFDGANVQELLLRPSVLQ